MKHLSALLFTFFLSSGIALAADMDAAARLPETWNDTIFRQAVDPVWMPGNTRFWYKIKTAPGKSEFVWVDAETGERKVAESFAGLGLPAPDPLRTSEMSTAARRTERGGPEVLLEIENTLDVPVELFWINFDGNEKPFGRVGPKASIRQSTYAGHVWMLRDPNKAVLAVLEAAPALGRILVDGAGKPPVPDPPRARGNHSPDGRWSAYLDQGRVMLHDLQTGQTRHLDVNLGEGISFRHDCTWAADSSAFMVQAATSVSTRTISFVESSPSGQMEPRLHTIHYPKPGDPLPQPVPVLFYPRENGFDWRRVDSALFATPYSPGGTLGLRASPKLPEFYLDYNQRGHQVYRILAVDAGSGAVRTVVEENSKTFVHYSGKTWRHWLDKTGELLWMSERSGWCHLLLVDVATGQVKNKVTDGEWIVRRVLHVDADKREVWFMAGGMRAGESPYHEHLCRASLDGGEVLRLTEGDGTHEVSFSPDRRWFIDAWSRVDQPAVHELRRSADGALVCELERADISRLLAAGWIMPERFVAKGRDGKTDIYGVLIRPPSATHASPKPILEHVYAGPQGSFAPVGFSRLDFLQKPAALGFVAVQADGMGTDNRGKAFHDIAWKNLKDAGFPDRIAWLRAAAAERPWMDVSRVGIYGTSAGGQSAMRALLDHHDFYTAAYAACGCHDNRMDKIWWNEQWMGWPVDESYAQSSNVEDAHKLQGHLMLVVGELDDNVDPASTTQVVGALQRTGKSFDFIPVIGAGHGAIDTPTGSRALMEHFIRYLKPGE